MFGRGTTLRIKCIVCGTLPLHPKTQEKMSDSESSRSYYAWDREGLNGKDRLQQMYSVDELGSLSPELLSVYQAAFVGTFIGATYGGLMSVRNIAAAPKPPPPPGPKQTMTFKPQDPLVKPKPVNVTAEFAKGAFSWGWRVGLIGGSVVLISSSISVYRGKTGVLEYIVAGGIIGSLSQVNQGLRATAVGGLLGTVLGTFGGCVAYGISVISGDTMEKRKFWRDGWKETQMKQTSEVMKKLRQEEEMKIKAERKSEVKVVQKSDEFVTDETERQALVWR